jgi:hypothetical protein
VKDKVKDLKNTFFENFNYPVDDPCTTSFSMKAGI